MDKSLSEIRAEAGRKGGLKGGKAKVKKGLAFHKEVARRNALETNKKKREATP